MLQPPAQDFYRFNPMRDHEGEVSRYHRAFVDDKDFTVNPKFIEQLRVDTCPETTPEGRALWLYFRLCQLLKYDEGYYYNDYRKHPNDDPFASFNIVGDVTAETPVTCFNFARIAVKLLNRIQGVHALMIRVGENFGHFRFGYYTDKVSVDAEPSSRINHFNDMARVKLGIVPQGLKVYNGEPIMAQLMARLAPKMLVKPQASLRPYIEALGTVQTIPNPTKINPQYLVQELKAQGVDGASAVQFFFDLNRHLAQPPFRFVRMALNADSSKDFRNLQPQLLVREREGQNIYQIDLQTLYTEELLPEIYRQAWQSGKLLPQHDEIEGSVNRLINFERGLER